MPEELAKREKHPFDMWDEMRANAAAGRFPKGTDIFPHKFHGLFYVAPNQDAFMLRLRLPGGMLSSHQATGLASVAEAYGDGYLHVTTRANLQIREIGAAHPIAVLTTIDELGLTSRGAGADNIRNLTGSPRRRDRPTGADRHAPADPRALSLHSEPPRTLRPAAQIQHRLRRRGAPSRLGGSSVIRGATATSCSKTS